MLDLSGVILPLTTPFAPGTENIDYAALEENVTKYNAIGFSGYFVNGSTGEFPYLTGEERIKCLQTVKRVSNIPVLACIALEGLLRTSEAIVRVAQEGADLAVILTPHYFWYFVNGSTGEFPYLTGEERIKCLQTVKRVSNIPVLACIALEGLLRTSEAIVRVAQEGADLAVILTPHYFCASTSNQAQIEFFKAVADSSPIPVMIYSNPSSTHYDIPVEVVVELSKHCTIVGFKDSSGNVDKLRELVQKTDSARFQVFSGTEAILYPAVLAGCAGAVSGMAGFLGKKICELYRLSKAGSSPEAEKLQSTLKEMGDIRARNASSLSGVCPPLPTPFDEDGNVDYRALDFNMHKWNEIPFGAYLVLGSNGEACLLTQEEKLLVMEFIRGKTDRFILAGAGCESTRETISVCKMVAGVGADAVLVVTPSFYKNAMTDHALINHYTQVADASPVPVYLYNNPTYTGIEISIPAITVLSEHHNIHGMKESVPNIARIAETIHRTKTKSFNVYSGSASFMLPAALLGAKGSIQALGAVLGREVCQLNELIESQKWEEAADLQKVLVAPNMAVTQRFGVPGLKHMMDVLHYAGGPPRPPLRTLTIHEREKVEKEFEEIANWNRF
ncbi:unnamed protein product [Cyprideis torosa]|uniref:4-hydroxy-2-oxoglutarate aldolase, mitochondrial n=1 Tax=Cyprideis torosa TaxID=163714 RepID=A0A7R8W7B5_9CRUS|nr:unnamed protein product [Cyprideis torosa]CAG0882602.1 unnamed protein product [Cyprideis torosa]